MTSYAKATAMAREMLNIRSYSNDELGVLLNENMSARSKGELPDEWFWADVELLNREGGI